MALQKNFKFIDLFAGIGGFHLAFDSLGCECVFASEKDKFARKTYKENFLQVAPHIFESGLFNDDILNVNPNSLPDFDILCAGFPCQPFSQAGQKKGFDEAKESRGNMFFVIRDIVKAKRPKALFLENVRHLLNHDNGRSFNIIKDIIENELGYDLHWKIVKASEYGLPQHRPRIYMIAFDRKLGVSANFTFPKPIPLKYTMSDIFNGKCAKDIGFTLRVGGRGSKIDDRRNWEFYLVDNELKRVGVSECKKMMGLPQNFIFPVSEVQAMKQLGNSVAVDAIREVARCIIETLESTNKQLYLSMDQEKRFFAANFSEAAR